MLYIHNTNVFYAIRDSLLEKNYLSYSDLYRKVNERLPNSNKEHNTLSYTVFTNELKVLIDENRIYKDEEKDSKLKIKPVSYSLTPQAIREHQLRILGIDKQSEKRKILYRFLFFLEISYGCRDDLLDKDLDKLLSSFGMSREDMYQQNKNIDRGIINKTYRLPNGIWIYEMTIQKHGLGADSTVYSCRIPGFSLHEIMHYLEQEKENKRPIDRRSPRIDNIYDIGEGEVKEALNSLKDADLITITNSVMGKESRYEIKDEKLRQLIEELYIFRILEFEKIREEWNYLRDPIDEEKKILKSIVGNVKGGEIIKESRFKRRILNKRKKKDREDIVAQARRKVDFIERIINKCIDDIKENYKTSLEDHGFPYNLLESFCYGNVR